MSSYLVFKIVPPIGPGLLYTALLLKDGVLDNSAQNTKSHSDTVVVVTVDTAAFLELFDWLAVDLQPVVEFLSLNTELR
jgi:hypothetical protein